MNNVIRSLYNLFHNLRLKPDGQTEFQGDLAVRGSLSTLALATPDAPTITNVGTAGATTYTYKITATVNGRETDASAGGTTNTGNATLDGTNYNTVSWPRVAGATGYKVYRTVGGATQGLIATITSGATLSVNDTGLAGGGETAPTVNNTQVGFREATIQFTRDNTAATGSVAYTGVGFKPRAILFLWAPGTGPNNSAAKANWGFVTDSLAGKCMANLDGNAWLQSSNAIKIFTDSGNVALHQVAEVASMDADGFTLNWTRTGVTTAGTTVLQAICIG